MTELSKTQIDRLGDRLRTGSIEESDLKILDDYRRSFGQAYEEVVRIIRERLNLDLTGRPAKSTSSIIEKLHRESIRLSQVQDIAGCRVVVTDMQEQERVAVLLRGAFPALSVVDRRVRPSYGYRAIHIIIQIKNKLIEVQVRTELQHNWAELSEKFSDKIDPAIKYGGGIKDIQEFLYALSGQVKDYEELEIKILDLQKKTERSAQITVLQEQLGVIKQEIAERIKRIYSVINGERKR